MPTFANCKLIALLFAVRRMGAKKDVKGRKALIGGGLMGSAFRVARSMANVPRPFLATSSKQISFTAYLSI